MPAETILLHFSATQNAVPACIQDVAVQYGYRIHSTARAQTVLGLLDRGQPAALVIDGTSDPDGALALCRSIKGETFTAVIPVVYVDSADGRGSIPALEAGVDEVISLAAPEQEQQLRFRMAIARAERDVGVHPTTRLPGTVLIEREVASRIRSGERFAVCYADLDHFKEFNDRYGYNHGDRVIRIVSRLLREVVRAHSPSAFVGHIGGDDFIFIVNMADLERCCRDVLEVFDQLVPLQYSPEDRDRGFYMGKDRRGQRYRVPLMTLSIGVVTNERREFTHTAQVSELATEMKSYAKTLPGSLFVVDRRSGDRVGPATEAEAETKPEPERAGVD